MNRIRYMIAISSLVFIAFGFSTAQEKSVRPGINLPFKNPNVKDFLEKFEGESREIFLKRDEIVRECALKPGMVVADIGAGTGLFTRLFSKEVGSKGKVYAVDISKNFLEHIAKTNKSLSISNVTTVLCTDRSAELPANSIEVVFICDTYHHFEFPHRTLETIHKALRANGRLILIDFHRIQGVSTDWTMKHVRADQTVFENEIKESGFKKQREIKDMLKENYFSVFTKVAKAQ